MDPSFSVPIGAVKYSRLSTTHTRPGPVPRGVQQSFVVTTTSDTGTGSLRKAIHDANSGAGPHTITFAIESGQQTIQLKTAFEAITQPVTIDGTTQPGYSGHPLIELDGTLLVNQTFDNGLELDAPGCTVRGLAINRFAGGIVIDFAGGDTVQGNYIGTDPTGSIPLPNIVVGVQLFGPRNLIGGVVAGAGNVISSNARNIEDDESGSGGYGGNLIQGNIIGLDATGGHVPQNGGPVVSNVGIFLYEASGDTIGGLVTQARNIISGNVDAIYIGNTPAAAGNVVWGNYIGLDFAGTGVPGNTLSGVVIWGGINNLIGSTTPSARNFIAGNAEEGIRIRAGAAGNLIQANYIGTDASGTVAAGNLDGISVKASHDNTIGGTLAVARNVIAGNTGNGITLDSASTGITVQGNFIGVTVQNSAVVPLANHVNGIEIIRAPGNLVGGDVAGAGNTIGGNTEYGVSISGDSAVQNKISGNGIGTDLTGTINLGNGSDGIFINASRNTVGGPLNVSKNLIRDNGGAGVYLLSGMGNLVSHNSITANTQLGIDIDPLGPNPNDPLDADAGANGRQNYPVIDSVIRGASSTVIKGHLNSVPSAQYTVEVFESATKNPSGYGEGETLLAATPVTTDAGGNATFDVIVTSVVDPYGVISSTATDAAGNTSEFSRDGKSILVTRPQAGEVFIVNEIDTVAWTLYDTISQVGVEYSTDNGRNFTLLPGIASGPGGKYLWVPPKGLLTTKARIHVFNYNDLSVGDTSGAFKLKGYELTRDSAGDFVRFDVERNGWVFPNDSEDVWPSAWYKQYDYRHGTDPNTLLPYAEDIQNLGFTGEFPDWPLWVYTFGIGQCYFDKTHGIYRPSAVIKWLSRAGQWDGSCFGFAVSSFTEFDDPGSLTRNYPGLGSFTDLYSVNLGSFSRQTVNQLWTTQFAKPDRAFRDSKYVTATADSTLAELKQMFKTGVRADCPLIMVTQSNIASGVHGVNPYRIERDSNNPRYLYIFVYDNNIPANNLMFVQVDSVANSWTYSGIADWEGAPWGLYLMEPAASLLGTQVMPDAAPASRAPVAAHSPRNAEAGSGTSTVYVTDGASVRMTDGAGDTLSYGNGVAINAIPGVSPIVPVTGRPHNPIGYDLPAGGNYSLALTGAPDSVTHVTAFADSTVFGFWRSNVRPGESDYLKVGAGFDVANHDNVVKLSELKSIIVQSDNEKVINLQRAALLPGDSIHLDVVNRQALRVTNNGDSLRYDLKVQHSSASGDAIFAHANLSVPPHSAAQIMPAWNGSPGNPVKILIDHGNLGVFNDSLLLSNDIPGWVSDPTLNTPVCLAAGWQTAPVIVKDGIGGSIVFWQDQRKGTNVSYTDFDIYAQRFNAAGWPQWATNGIPIMIDSVNDLYPRAVSDGRGGAVVIWWTALGAGHPQYQIHAQRVDSTGAFRWGNAGIVVDSYPNVNTESYSVVSDGSGGVIIASESMPGVPADVFAQRIDSSGILRWGTHGVALAPGAGSAQSGVSAAADGSGGVVVGWGDFRYGGTDSAGALFMQRVDASGTLLWGQSGVKVTNHSGQSVSILTHAPGDYVVLWAQNPWLREPSGTHIMVQKLDGNGISRWQMYGLPLTPSAGTGQVHPDFCDDRRGGAFIVWEEARNNSTNVYAQRVDSTGVMQWLSTGAPLVTGGPAVDRLPEIVENGKGGAFVIWEDMRNATVDQTNEDIYVQGLAADGSLAWQSSGIPVSSAPSAQQFSIYFKRGIALTDTNGIAVIAWEDGRDSGPPTSDVGQLYAQRVVFPPNLLTGIRGIQGGVPGTFRLDQNYPNPFNPTTTIGYMLPAWEHVSLEVYNLLGQKIASLIEEDQSPGEHRVVFNGTRFASGVYFYRLRAGNFVQTRKFMMLK